MSHPAIDDCWNRIGVRGDRSCPELREHVHCRNCPVQRAVAAALLAHHVPDDYITQWTEHVSRPAHHANRDTTSAVIFRIGAEWLALPAAAIQEVSNLEPIHRVPHRTGGVVLGVANVRGELLTCLSLPRVFGLEHDASPHASTPLPSHKRLLVIRWKDLRGACPVDYVEGVHRYSPEALRAVPATVAKAGTRYSRALLAWRDQTVGVLDEDVVFSALRRGMS